MLKKSFVVLSSIVLLVVSAQINKVNADVVKHEQQINLKSLQTNESVISEYKKVSPFELVAHPSKYINKKIKITGKFDKFTAIGLDYPPVNRDAKNHISFMIKKGNVTAYNIPLSELKLILKREYAEKELLNIESGDDIEIYGNVFSLALGDPWVDVDKVVILTQKDNKKTENKTTDNKTNEGK